MGSAKMIGRHTHLAFTPVSLLLLTACGGGPE